MEKLKVGLVGLGRAAFNMHCSEIDLCKDFLEVAAVCDILPERNQDLVERYPNAKTYDTINELILDTNIDIISIATRSPDHVENAKIALATGKIVYLEKPIALNYQDALELAKLDKQYPNQLFIRQNRRFEPAFNHIQEIIKSGKLGEIYEVKLCRHRFQLRDDWQTIVECGGGQMNNWGPHLIDHAIQFLASPVAELFGNRKLISSAGNAEDHIKMVLVGENGRIVDIEISDGVAISGDVYHIFGTRGTLKSTDETTLELKYMPTDFVVPKNCAHSETLPRTTGYGNAQAINWIEESIPVAPSNNYRMELAYLYLYNAISGITPYPITIDTAVEVVRLTELLKKRYPITICRD